MASRVVDRLILIPALIVLGSLALSGCTASPAPGGDSSDSSSSGKDATKSDSQSDDEASAPQSGAANCPAGFEDAIAKAGAADGGTYTLISPKDFAAQEVGADYLTGGCLMRVDMVTEAASSTTDFGYIPGDAQTVAAIGANLEAAAFTKLADGVYSQGDTFGVLVFDGGKTAGADGAGPAGLDFGDEFVVIMATRTR